MNNKLMIKGTQAIVLDILQVDKKARSSDTYLFTKVLEKLEPTLARKPFNEVLLMLGKDGLPSVETVGRARRKAQELYPQLKANEAVAEQRAELQMDFYDYAKGRF